MSVHGFDHGDVLSAQNMTREAGLVNGGDCLEPSCWVVSGRYSSRLLERGQRFIRREKCCWQPGRRDVSGQVADDQAVLDIEVDIVIVGGGPQGLWVLELLREKGFACVLLEKAAAGAGQSAHAEWFLHRGSVFRKQTPIVEHLNPSARLWETHLANKQIAENAIAARNSYVAFSAATAPLSLLLQWEDWGMELAELSRPFPPPFERSPAIQCLIRTGEMSIHPTPVLERFAADHDAFFIQFQGQISFCKNGGVITAVEATRIATGERLRIKPQIVILAAGAGNADLLEAISPEARDAARSSTGPPVYQRQRFGTLLLIRDRDGAVLERANAFFWESRDLLVIYREDGPGRLWLVSTADSWRKPADPEPNEGELRECVQAIWKTLVGAFPNVEEARDLLEFTVSTGALIEPNHLSEVSNLQIFQNPSNLAALFPQRLTLAPRWATQVCAWLAESGVHPRVDAAELALNGLSRIPIASPPWRERFLSFDHFHRDFL